MENRIAAVFLTITLTGALLGCVLYYVANYDQGAMTLAELSAGSPSALEASPKFAFLSQPIQKVGDWLSELETEVIIYSTSGFVALLLIVRLLFAAVRAIREEIAFRVNEHNSYRFSALPPDTFTARQTPSLRILPKDAAVGAEPDTRGYAARFTDIMGHGVNALWRYLRAHGQGLSGRMILTFTTLVTLFGIITAALVYYTLAQSLTGHAIQRAKIIALNIGDSAPAYLIKQDADKLRELLRKQVSNAPMAYVLVERRSGEIFAHSFAILPEELHNQSATGGSAVAAQRTLRVGQGMVYEVSVPILDGQSGRVRVGIWQDDVDAAIGEIVTPLIKWLVLIVIGGAFTALFLAWNISRPIVRLVRLARRISHGELDAPSLGVEDKTEFGELSRALERMRSSVKAAVMRLS